MFFFKPITKLVSASVLTHQTIPTTKVIVFSYLRDWIVFDINFLSGCDEERGNVERCQ
jgi:hypothetical protein